MASPWEKYGTQKPWEKYGEDKVSSGGIEEKLPSGVKTLLGLGETAAQIGAGTVAQPLSGLAGMGAAAGKALGLTEQEPAEVVRKVGEKLSYEPKTDYGKAISGAVSAPFRKLGEISNVAGEAVAEKTGSPALGAAVNAALQAAPMIAGKGLGKVGALREAAPVAENITKARNLGYRITPEEGAGGPVSKTIASLSGEPRLAKKISKDNQQIHNDLIAEDLGLKKGDTLSHDVIDKIRREEGSHYEAVRNTGRITSDPQYNADLDKIIAEYQGAAKDFPAGENAVQSLVKTLKQPSFDANSAVSQIKLMRKAAKKAFRQQDYELAHANLDASAALESQIERHLLATGQPENLVQNFRDARVKIAKTIAADKALNDATGNINPQSYAKMLDQGVPLTEGPRQVAEFAKAFPRSAQRTDRLGGVGPTYHDLLLGAISGGKELPLLFARPAARSLLASKPAQTVIHGQSLSPAALEALRKYQSMPGVGLTEMTMEQNGTRQK